MNETEKISSAAPIVPKGLVLKLCKIMGEIGYVEKRGENKFKDGKTKYYFATEADLVAAVRDKLAEAHIFIFPDAISTNREGQLTDVMIAWTFVDGDTGETWTSRMPGCGSDFEDKGVYKAITGSEKYLLMKSFLIPTGDDPEKTPTKTASDAVVSAKLGDYIIMRPDGEMVILTGGGVNLLRSEYKSEELGAIGLVNLSKGYCIPREFVGKLTNMAVAKGIKVNLDKQAELPPFHPVSGAGPGAAPSQGVAAPGINIITNLVTKSVKVKGKPEQVLVVTWNGKQASVAPWFKGLFALITEAFQKQTPIDLVLDESGKYINVTAVKGAEKGQDGVYRFPRTLNGDEPPVPDDTWLPESLLEDAE